VFDHPQRSLRGRIITHAYGFHLQKLDHTESLQEVRGSDDAAKACWIPIHEVKREDMFEDHYDIIQTMVDCINTREI
jgi:bifunctional NMN adenylyltransferase/nudix hydrolase